MRTNWHMNLAVGILASLVTAGCQWQERLIFFPPPPHVGQLVVPAGHRLQELALPMHDGVRLEGWLILPPVERPPLLIYFGGNAEEASAWTGAADRYPGYALLLVNYRGYGRSEGKPGERELFGDAIEIYDGIRRRDDLDGQRIVLHGSSLGTGVAVYLAAQRPVQAVVLVAPYDSIRAIAQKAFPWLPVSRILRHPFDSLSRAPLIKAPLLCLVAAEDEVIPVAHSRRLFEAWGGSKAWREFPGETHNTVAGSAAYWRAIADFLSSL